DGEQVADLLEEACSRDIHGVPCHAKWVECPDREHYCYTMDRNNPVWREYLKAIIRIQIDAGVDGVQLDEAELPITSIRYGGCFCKDCMKGFRAYLQQLPTEDLSPELAREDLSTFHYGEWLLARGHDFQEQRESTPLFWDYLRFQRRAITQYFGELADYAREYAASKGRQILVSGNFFNLLDMYYPLEPKVDLIITEMRNTAYRQPEWYRYVAGFAGEKPVVVVENPYGGVVPELVEQLKVGRGYDLFRLSLYEAAALGANMSVPYGSWMGSEIEDAYYAPHDLCVEIQRFLAGHEDLYSRRTFHEVAVVFSIESAFQRVARRDMFVDNRVNPTSDVAVPFWQVCEALSNASQPYDVLFFPDGDLRPDSLTLPDLDQYRTLILPDCQFLTPEQSELVRGFLDRGGNVVVLGDLALDLGDDSRQAILDHERASQVESFTDSVIDQLPCGAQLSVQGRHDLGIAVHRTGDGASVHIVRYGYDASQDRVPDLPELSFDLRLPEAFQTIDIASPLGSPQAELTVDGTLHHVSLQNVPLYTVVALKEGES
ncbi:MAG TPA: hypothetical protein VGR16_13755, partial [Thermomicrobiales bacterium]|nr:hypothetical protein [Thermomicrobiales bacterium]